MRHLYLLFKNHYIFNILALFCIGSVSSAFASDEITLTGIDHVIAVPFEISQGINLKPDVSEELKEKARNLFSRHQAELECRSHLCGLQNCNALVTETHKESPIKANRSVRLKNSALGSNKLVLVRVFPNSRIHTGKSEFYFESIRCKYEAPQAEEVVAQLSEVQKTVQETSPASSDCAHANEQEMSQGWFQSITQHPATQLGVCTLLKGSLDSLTKPAFGEPYLLTYIKNCITATGIHTSLDGALTKNITASRDRLFPQLATGVYSELLQLQNSLKELREKYKVKLENKEIYHRNIEPIREMLDMIDGRIAETLKALMEGAGNPMKMHMLETTANQDKAAITEAMEYLISTLNMAYSTRTISKDAQEKMNQFVNSHEYEEQTLDRIENFITEIAHNSNLPRTATGARPAIIYLKGAQGRGKSTITKGIIDSIGMEHFELKVSPYSSADDLSEQLAEILKKSTTTNPIIEADEFGDLFADMAEMGKMQMMGRMNGRDSGSSNDGISFFKRILGTSDPFITVYPPKPKMGSPFMGAMGGKPLTVPTYYDLRRLTWVKTGNYDILDPSLQTKISNVLEVPAIPFKAKMNIATHEFRKQLKDASGINVSMTEPLSKEDEEMIKTIVNYDEQMQPGIVRILKDVIRDYAIYKVSSQKKPVIVLVKRKKEEKTASFDYKTRYAQFDSAKDASLEE